MVHKLIFGINFQQNALPFHPFVPQSLKGSKALTNFKYRKAVQDIYMEGYGNKVKSFSLDGKQLAVNEIPDNLEGKHEIKIILANNSLTEGKINKLDNYVSPAAQQVSYASGKLSWQNAA